MRKADVAMLVNDLLGSETAIGKYADEIDLQWDGQITRLESKCMKISTGRASICLDLAAPGREPRQLDNVWFKENIVAADPGGPADLVAPGDNAYDPSLCTVNMYFTGNIKLGQGFDPGMTQVPVPGTPPPKHFVIINDFANVDPAAAPHPEIQKALRTLLHEVGCHWTTRLDHTCGPPPLQPCPVDCPNDLCMPGDVVTQCLLAGKAISAIPPDRKDTTSTNMKNCGESP